MKVIINYAKKDKKILYDLFLSLITYFGIFLYFGINTNINYNLFFLLAYIPILLFFLKCNFDITNKQKKISLVVGGIIVLAITTGKIVNNVVTENNVIIFDVKHLLLLLIEFCFLLPFFFRGINCLYIYSNKINFINEKSNRNSNKFFLISWLLIFISYLPYFWRYFPAMLTTDSFLQLKFLEEGIKTDVHPFVQTNFVGLFYDLGKLIFHNNNYAIAFYTIVQMAIMSGIFAFGIRYLYKKNFDIRICIILLLCYSLLPQFSLYSVTLWKDIIFGGSFVIILIALLELVDKINVKNIFLFVIGVLIMLFFRNNGIYILIVMTPFILFSFRKNVKIFGPVLFSLIIFYYLIKGPVFSIMKVDRTNSVEAYSIPLQQIARVFALEKSVDDESLKYLNSIMDTKDIKNNYVPFIADPIKNMTNREKVGDTKEELLKAWSKLLIKYPNVYVEAYLSQTVGYWSTDVNYWTTLGVTDKKAYNVKNETNMPNILCKLIDYTASKKIPFISLCWSIGLGFIITFLSFTVACYKKSKYKIAYVPFLGLWCTMMLAAPVYAEYRYVYGLFTSLPLIIFIPFIMKNKMENKSKL